MPSGNIKLKFTLGFLHNHRLKGQQRFPLDITKPVTVNFFTRYHRIHHIGKIEKQFSLPFSNAHFHTKVKRKPHRALDMAVD